jgi:hypothetical protein
MHAMMMMVGWVNGGDGHFVVVAATAAAVVVTGGGGGGGSSGCGRGRGRDLAHNDYAQLTD